MRKNKNLILPFLALNVVVSTYSQSSSNVNSNKMYDRIIGNFETGKSNDANYKLLEGILNKRNKELKDLYLQSNYIVKPEYLEWQIFFTSFYGEKNKGDNTDNSAKYSSGESSGYFDENGRFIANGSSSSKPYKDLQSSKHVDLGVSIPMKGIDKSPLNINVVHKVITVPTLNIPVITVDTPEVSKNFDVPTFQPITTIQAPYLGALSKLWPRTNRTGEIATITTANNYYENTANINIDGSTGNKSIFYLNNGKIVNNGSITMKYTGSGTPQYQGIWANEMNKRYIDFENNGNFIIDTSITGDIGSVMGIHYYTWTANPDELTPEMFTTNPNKVVLSNGRDSDGAYIRNFGHVEDYGAVWTQFEDTEGDYISHLPGKPVGSVIVDASKTNENQAGQAFQLWRCCSNITGDILERIDPGIVVVRRGSTGINVVEQNNGMRTEIINLNNDPRYPGFSDTPNDKSRDSQIIVEGGFKSTGEAMGGNAIVLTGTTSSIVDGLAEVINTPIYLTDQKTNGIVITSATL